MTYEEAIREYGELEEWDKLHEDDVMSWTSPIDTIGPRLFSFDDGRNVYNVYGGGPCELTPEQIAIFKKESSTLADLYLNIHDSN